MLKRVGLSSLWQQRHPKTAWLCGLVPISAATGQEARGRNGREADGHQGALEWPLFSKPSAPAQERGMFIEPSAQAVLCFCIAGEGCVVPDCGAAVFAHKCFVHRPCTSCRKEKTDAGGMFIGTNAIRRATKPRRARMTLETGHLGP